MFLKKVLRKSYSSLRGDDRHWWEEGGWNREKHTYPTFSSLVSLKLKETGSHLNNTPTLIAALEREACSVFSMPHGEDSLTESWRGYEMDGALPLLHIGPGGSRKQKTPQTGSCHSTMPATSEGGQDQNIASSSPG